MNLSTFKDTYTATAHEIRYERPEPEVIGVKFAEGFSRQDYVDQINLEYEAREKAYAREMLRFHKSMSEGTEHETTLGKGLIGQNIATLANALRAEHGRTTRGRQNALKRLMEHYANYEHLAVHTLEACVRGITEVRPLVEIAISLVTSIEDELNFSILERQHGNIARNVKARIQTKRDIKHRRETLKWAVKYQAEQDWVRFTTDERVHFGHALIALAATTLGWFKAEQRIEGGHKRIYLIAQDNFMWLLEETQREIARLARPTYAPMVVPPRKWSPETVRRGAYLTPAGRPLSMIKTRNKSYLRELQTAGMEKVYDALNRIQETPVRINKTIYNWLDTFLMQQLPWAMDIGLPAMHKLDIKDYTPTQPEGLPDSDYRVKEYQKACREFYLMEASERSKLSAMLGMMEMAKSYLDRDRFFVPWQGDTRMRVYPVSKLNFQGADYVKALCQFADGVALGKHGLKWLMIHMANLMGVDKVTFEERVKWVKEHKAQIIALAKDPRECRDFLMSADKPMQAIACATELAEAWSMKNHEEFVSYIPIALDGSCSGLQILGAALRCEKTGEHVNLIPAGRVADIYRVVADIVTNEFKSMVGECKSKEDAEALAAQKALEVFTAAHDGDATNFDAALALAKEHAVREDKEKGTEKEASFITEMRKVYRAYTEAYAWLQFGINRGTVKRNVMTYCYGSAQFGFKEQCMEDIIYPAYMEYKQKKNRGEDAEWHFHGNGSAAAALMAKHAYAAVKRTVLRAAQAMDWMQKAAYLIAQDNAPVRWTTPLGFPVLQEYRVTKEVTVDCVIFGKRRQLNIREESLDYDKNKAKNSIAPNVVHSLDSCHLQSLVNLAYEKHGIKHFALIHDSFGTHAGNTEVFFKVIREAMVEMFENTDVFAELEQEFKAQCNPEKHDQFLKLPEYGNLDLHGILESDFAFA
ncbi:DNA-directed RNA polymerase [Vibrio vulnificus]|uniref:DNA-directed RNA polymerase n=1 Tax=Vibrio vulnificus TaxID=672 RepID=UPI0001F5BDE1|nr:DNA-directed RNA polymerase [Vibrio vulnificus]ADV88572.1 possible DNA-dependent RNA polymerase [Vibrio vulnificus MO6-24/O]